METQSISAIKSNGTKNTSDDQSDKNKPGEFILVALAEGKAVILSAVILHCAGESCTTTASAEDPTMNQKVKV